MKKICITIFFLLFANAAFAACLQGHPSIQQEYAKSFAVLIGTVISVEAVPESAEYFDGHNYTLTVGDVLKGSLSGTVQIFSENSSGRFLMESESTYILFIYSELGRLQVSSCGNSGLVSESGEVVNAVRALVSEKKK